MLREQIFVRVCFFLNSALSNLFFDFFHQFIFPESNKITRYSINSRPHSCTCSFLTTFLDHLFSELFCVLSPLCFDTVFFHLKMLDGSTPYFFATEVTSFVSSTSLRIFLLRSLLIFYTPSLSTFL